jgi:uncharacterized protein (DUF58 family)
MPSLKLMVLALSTSFIVLIGSFIRNPILLISSIPVFTYFLISIITYKELKINLEIKRNLSKEIVREDEELEVKITVSNKGEKIDFLLVTDSVQEGVKIVKGSNSMLLSIDKNETKEFSYFVKVGEIGKYKLGPIGIIASNIEGTYVFKKVIEDYTNFKVSPKISLFGEIILRPRYNKPWPGDSPSRSIGIGNEFYAVTESFGGEGLRRINWKATAKTNKLMKNVYHAELSSDVLIILDYRAVNDIKFKDKSLLLHSARASLLLAYRLLRDKHRVGLLVLGEEIHRLKPSFGRKQFDRIIFSVLESEPGKLSDLRLLKDLVSLVFPITTQIILISPILDYEITLAIAELAKKGYDIISVVPNPFERKPLSEMDIVDRIIRIERENYLAMLKRFSKVLEWDVDKPLDIELKKVSEAWLRLAIHR